MIVRNGFSAVAPASRILFATTVCKFHISHESRNIHFGRDAYQHMYVVRTNLSLFDFCPLTLT